MLRKCDFRKNASVKIPDFRWRAHLRVKTKMSKYSKYIALMIPSKKTMGNMTKFQKNKPKSSPGALKSLIWCDLLGGGLYT